ncbi:PHD finger protein 7-like isoform X2 [Pseudopipra pipra]|uniref:PHD finger protein 7-like isoform X2 n=1 Tax=Pseudopipra pipra TaxID=415032 RepID=UPI003139F2A5
MSDREEEAPEGREPECLLCRRSEADPDICGNKIQKHGFCAHVFCLYFASLLEQQENERVGLFGFLPRDILHAVNRAAQTSCCICGQSGATISCWETDCDLSFHLPCAKQGGCVTQFIPPYRAYCPAHSPEQAVEATPEPGTECLICMEPVEDRKTFNTLVCPTCKTTWFHRDCIQGQALRSGILSFQCPICRSTREFLVEMFLVGIRIPFREPSWEENDAFAELLDRHRHCDASECLFPGGRQEADEEGPWELLLCSSCAAEGTHRHCSGLRNSITSWECDGCAGLGTASRDESGLAGVSVDRQSGLEPCDGSREPQTTSTNTGSLVLSGLSPSSAPLDTISPSTSAQVPAPVSSAPQTSHRRTNRQTTWEQPLQTPSQETSSSSPDSQVTSGSSQSTFTETEDSSSSSSRGPDRRQNHPRRQRRAQNPHFRSRSPLDRTHEPSPSPGRCRPRPRPSGTSRRRNRSHLQRETPNPSGRSRSRHDRSQVRAPSAGRSSRSRETSRTSRNQNRSRQQHQTPNASGRSRSRRVRNCVRAPSAGSRIPSQEASGTSRRRNRSRRQRQTANPAGRSRSPLDRNCTPPPSAGRRNSRETAARSSQRQQHSRQQRRTRNSSTRSRSRRDGRRVRAPSTARRTHRWDGETRTHR